MQKRQSANEVSTGSLGHLQADYDRCSQNAPPKDKQVPLAIASNRTSAEGLDKIVSVLEQRLESVLRACAPEAQTGLNGPVICGLADVLQQNAASIDSSIRRIGSILERLEL